MMQANSTRGICPSMTTHKDQQLGQKVMQSIEGLIVLKNGGYLSMQLARSTTRS